MGNSQRVAVYLGEELARYGFGDGHPFGPDRQAAFHAEFKSRGLHKKCLLKQPVECGMEDLQRFHSHKYLEFVSSRCAAGVGYLDGGDTPALKGINEAGLFVVGSVLDAAACLLRKEFRRAMLPIAGLHHAGREHAAGFCVYNDIGVLIESLREVHGLTKIGYVDIDAHHGDGVYYAFDSDPDLVCVDIHEDGRFLYPGTGTVEETGQGNAAGSKLNIPMPPGATDAEFMQVWPRVEEFLAAANPEFVILQCGADSLANDPITHLRFTAAAHHHAARRLTELAERLCEGRLLALGGGGYNRANLAQAWNSVIEGML